MSAAHKVVSCTTKDASDFTSTLQTLREAVAIEPYDTDANLRLSELLAQAGDLGGAREHLARAISSRADLRNRLDILQSYFARDHPLLETLDASPGVSIPVPIDQPGGRLDLSQLEVFRGHRSGLKYGLEALAPLHCSAGVRIDSALERTMVAVRSGVQKEAPWSRPRVEYSACVNRFDACDVGEVGIVDLTRQMDETATLGVLVGESEGSFGDLSPASEYRNSSPVRRRSNSVQPTAPQHRPDHYRRRP